MAPSDPLFEALRELSFHAVVRPFVLAALEGRRDIPLRFVKLVGRTRAEWTRALPDAAAAQENAR